MLSSVNHIKSEALYERVFSILRMYTDYLNETPDPLDAIKMLYEGLKFFPDRVLACDDDKALLSLEKNINAYEMFIKEIDQPLPVTA